VNLHVLFICGSYKESDRNSVYIASNDKVFVIDELGKDMEGCSLGLIVDNPVNCLDGLS
jgi:hypothetical protein